MRYGSVFYFVVKGKSVRRVQVALFSKRGEKYQKFASTFGKIEPIQADELDNAIARKSFEGNLEVAGLHMAN